MKQVTINLYQVDQLDADAFLKALQNYCGYTGKTIGPEEYKKQMVNNLFLANGSEYVGAIARDADRTTKAADKSAKEAKDEAIKIGMTRGVALGCASILRCESGGEIWRAAGMSITECIAHGVDLYDLKKLIPEYSTNDDAEPIARHLLNLSDAQDHWIDAQEFLSELSEGLARWDTLRTQAATDADNEDLKGKVQDAETYLSDAREAYIEIVRDTLND